MAISPIGILNASLFRGPLAAQLAVVRAGLELAEAVCKRLFQAIEIEVPAATFIGAIQKGAILGHWSSRRSVALMIIDMSRPFSAVWGGMGSGIPMPVRIGQRTGIRVRLPMPPDRNAWSEYYMA